MSDEKPRPMPDVYDWNDVQSWLRAAHPKAEREVTSFAEREPGHALRPLNRSLVVVSMKDHDDGLHGDMLSAETRAFLRAEFGAMFSLYVWW